MAAWGSQLAAAAREWKPPALSKGLGVKLDVDMLTPALESVKTQYAQLPQPVREVLPFAGAPGRGAQSRGRCSLPHAHTWSSSRMRLAALPARTHALLAAAGVSLVTSAVVGRLHQARYGALRDDHDQLQAQMALLEGQMSEATMKR